jgi:signal transduction histidine kinase
VSGRGSRGGLRSPRLVGTVVLALLSAVLFGTLLVIDQRHRARLTADATVRAAVASAVAGVSVELQSQLSEWTAPDPDPGAEPVRSAASVARLPGLLPIAVLARDTGLPRFADLADPPALVVPVYAGPTPPQSTDQRRRTLRGYRLVPLSLGPTLTRLAPADGGLAVHGPTRAVASTAARAPSATRSFATGLELPAAAGWVVAGWVPAAGTPPVTWVWLLGILLLFGGLGALGVAAQRRGWAAEQQRRRFDHQQTLVSGLAPVVQASLDLGEVAPAVAAHLVQSLSLAGVSLSVPSEAGERPLFSWGTPPDATVPLHREPPERLAPGGTFAISLNRAGRTLGVLRVVAGEALLHSDLRALATATELLGATLAHAETFARQHQVVERLRSVDELKTVFLATASHELRTPVTAIVGFSALLLEQWDAMDLEQDRMLLERVVSNARELQSLIEQLLDFARLERGVRPTNDELLDVGSAVAGILAAHPELVSEHELSCRLATHCLIRGSTPAIERIVTNLVGNAGKYSPPGTRITVTVRQENGTVAILVDDEGSGVAPEDREHVFSRFYRGHGTGVTSTRGAGIGLAIVAEYTACLGGSATVTDAPGGGARFTVALPSAQSLDALPPAPRTEAARNGAPRVPIS